MTLPPAAALALLLAVPAMAQDDLEARMNACMAGIDLDAIAERADAFAAAEDYQARVDALCAAGDAEGATAYARDAEAAFYAADPDAAKMRACIVDILGEDAVGTADDPCEP